MVVGGDKVLSITTDYPYIAIEGVIGVGKTTLARLLRSAFKAETMLEAFDANPFLSDFYADRSRYAFQTQLFFLLSRYQQQQTTTARLQRGPLLTDYFFEKDRLFAHLNINSADELAMYDRLYEALSEKVRAPDLVIYLRARVDTLMARIAMRDRTYERQMDRDYIAALRQGYERLFASYAMTPLLVIESDELDFVRHPEDLSTIEQRIRSTLSGVRQPPLPRIAFPMPPRPAWKLTTTPPVEPQSEANWQALGDFLALAEAVGRIGGTLAQQAPIGPAGVPDTMRAALGDAHRLLVALARRTGVKLESSGAAETGVVAGGHTDERS